jgi:hypothetical protein
MRVILSRNPTIHFCLRSIRVNPNVAIVGGLQSQGAEGEVVVNLLRALGNAGSGVLRLSLWVNNMASNRPPPLNSPGVGNQKGKHFYDFCLKLE